MNNSISSASDRKRKRKKTKLNNYTIQYNVNMTTWNPLTVEAPLRLQGLQSLIVTTLTEI